MELRDEVKVNGKDVVRSAWDVQRVIREAQALLSEAGRRHGEALDALREAERLRLRATTHLMQAQTFEGAGL